MESEEFLKRKSDVELNAGFRPTFLPDSLIKGPVKMQEKHGSFSVFQELVDGEGTPIMPSQINSLLDRVEKLETVAYLARRVVCQSDIDDGKCETFTDLMAGDDSSCIGCGDQFLFAALKKAE